MILHTVMRTMTGRAAESSIHDVLARPKYVEAEETRNRRIQYSEVGEEKDEEERRKI